MVVLCLHNIGKLTSTVKSLDNRITFVILKLIKLLVYPQGAVII
jgi:hypothetical protein